MEYHFKKKYMKTSNLLGVLALGGIGYYLLKNKNKPVVSDFAQQIALSPNPLSTTQVSNAPISTSTISTTPISNAPVSTTAVSSNLASTSPVTTTPVSVASPKIETALTSLGLEKSCNIPIEGWGWDGDLVHYYMYKAGYKVEITKLITNPQLKENRGAYVDDCGNIYKPKKKWENLMKDTSPEKMKDGLHRGIIHGFSPYDKEVPYYIKNGNLYLLPFKLIQDYRNKYIVPISDYLKRLPKMDLTEKGFKYPENGEWKTPPFGLIKDIEPPLWDGGVEDVMKTTSDNYVSTGARFLIKNPNVRNKYGAYVDQFGNIIDHMRNGSSPSGTAIASSYAIAEYRVNHGIPF